MESCKGDKVSVYQPSFMIDNILMRKAIDQNGEFPVTASAGLARRGSNEEVNCNDTSATPAVDVVSADYFINLSVPVIVEAV